MMNGLFTKSQTLGYDCQGTSKVFRRQTPTNCLKIRESFTRFLRELVRIYSNIITVKIIRDIHFV